ncbi:Phosphoglycerate kinase [Flavobacterium psychrophilum]|nr:Phosphoglycerate kinase [Flavobacterium psychrophilum]SNA64167.1 Phosphoglycerate kinase [Flavobacterium psychrophilum]SNA67462.1 Phosphoglycerate kinase [Flavobacterium psychrophilum]SNA71830.1 Phosphoglycerate kinase [Flavobacterium psychrophilum]SNA73216.1 Phosphoglycerate kinase [Flavobacterium psychrophilum]
MVQKFKQHKANTQYKSMKTIYDFNFHNKKALIRVDFNVPLNESHNVTDASRIEAAKPTINKILADGGSVILMSHLGRPKGIQAQFSLQHIVAKVSQILGISVQFSPNCIGEETEKAALNLKPGEVLLLENLRFYNEEEAGDIEFSKKLAKLGDIYVNDAFGTAHRAHASTTIIAQFFPDYKCFGALLAKEIESINKVLKNSEKPVTAVLGGSKVSSKITVIENILDKVDHMIIGGGMTFTFIKALGGKIGNSLCEDDKIELALEILRLAKEKNVQIHLPVDVVAANSFSNEAETQIIDINNIPDGWQGLDAGPKSLESIKKVILESKTILWNGPLGVFEMSNFANGTIQLGHFIAEATKNGAFSLVGGGDSVAAVKQFGLEDKMSYVSTGGGAMLEMLEGRVLPGIAAILD